jgi:hypothetical protein
MPIQSSFPKVAEQVITLNRNVVDILAKINQITTSNDSSVSVQIADDAGVLRTFTLPTIGALKSDIETLKNNINTLYNINTTGSMVETSPGTFKKVVAVDLNREPNAINNLGPVNNFVASNNWFFESMLNPMLSVEIDLTGQIEDTVRMVRTRRYIVDFEKDNIGNLTPNGQSALNSFNNIFLSSSTITITDFESWHRTTPGVVNPNNPSIDEQNFELEPNTLRYQGRFSVLKAAEDRINRKLWYYLDTMNYYNNSTNSSEALRIGSELIIDIARSSTRYKVIEVSAAERKVRLERIEGLDPVPVATNYSMKIYSPVINDKKVRISIGYDERNVVFAKPIDGESRILSQEWSKGTAFYTKNLTLKSTTPENGRTMESYYIDYVYDYGTVLKDLVNKNIPAALGGTPTTPEPVASDFKVVQINKHLTDTPDSNIIKQKHNYQQTLKSEINQIQQAIIDKTKKAKVDKYLSDAQKKQASMEIDELTKKKESKTKLLNSVTQEILNLTTSGVKGAVPKFAVRGFIPIPDATIVSGTPPQNIVQFRIQYRYKSKDGTANAVTTYTSGTTTGAWSDWVEMKSLERKRIYNPATNTYTWETPDLANAESVNFNQLEIPIQANEIVEFQVKSISEVGWPSSPIESDWSTITSITFPDDLMNVMNQNDTISKEAMREDLKSKVMTELSAKGLDDHLGNTVTKGNSTYYHDSTKIYYGLDSNGNPLSMYEYLFALEQRIKGLEERINSMKGVLKVTIIDTIENRIQEVSNLGTYKYSMNCEDFMKVYTDTNVSGNRVYENRIYNVQRLKIKIENSSADSSLGLLSNKTYIGTPDIYRTEHPQMFWVNKNDILQTSVSGSSTNTQLDNQFIWAVNYDSDNKSLSENIGSGFVDSNSNSIISQLAKIDRSIGFKNNQKLNFIGGNNILTESSKWNDPEDSPSSQDLFLTTVHPVTPGDSLVDLISTNTDKMKYLEAGESVEVPISVYFKANALSNTLSAAGFSYIDFKKLKQSNHTKKIRFQIQNQTSPSAITFTVEINIRRS